MSVLKQKLDKAAEQFQTHNFKEALQLYEDCLSFSFRTEESSGVIYNIMSTKGALLCILGEFDRAMSTLNEVLRSDPSHYLALMRRSQVYKKKGKFNRALKDLEVCGSYCPDNLQITAMKIQIENLKNKNKNQNSSEESDSEEDLDEETLLNFSNLKKIDRSSVSIVPDPKKRKSRVTISGDTAVVYERAEDDADKPVAINASQAKEKYLKTYRQLQTDDNSPVAKPSNIVVKATGRSKSILKNKHNTCSIMIVEDKKDIYGGRESKLLQRLKDIDGKMISSNHSLENSSIKEVEFRKSIFAQAKTQAPETVASKSKDSKKGPRKSCLKRSSFQSIQKEVKQKPAARRSKFQMMSRNSIDGVVIKNRKSIQADKIIENDKEKDSRDDDSDGGSSYNIYGSGQQLVISNEISQQFGLGKSKDKSEAKSEAKGKQRGKSILKKNSILSKPSSVIHQQPEEVKESNPPAKKAKKSVMFTKSRFADD